MQSLRLGILDCHALVRETLSRYLCGEAHLCPVVEGEARPFLERLKQEPVDLVLLDPVLDPRTTDFEQGISVLRELRALFPSLRTVVMTATPDASALERCYQEGAFGFLFKPTSPPETMLEAIAAAARGERRFPMELMEHFNRLVGQEPAAPAKELAALTTREREVLGYIAAGYDNLKIGAVMEISERTVKSHVAAIYRKMRVENRVQLALRARELGLQPPP